MDAREGGGALYARVVWMGWREDKETDGLKRLAGGGLNGSTVSQLAEETRDKEGDKDSRRYYCLNKKQDQGPWMHGDAG